MAWYVVSLPFSLHSPANSEKMSEHINSLAIHTSRNGWLCFPQFLDFHKYVSISVDACIKKLIFYYDIFSFLTLTKLEMVNIS